MDHPSHLAICYMHAVNNSNFTHLYPLIVVSSVDLVV